ncbi:ead/Ea22-like family protein [Salmonella enterica]|nr:ead/Ea22-like family protein [Salmonella enterica]EAS5077140.1 ead/Ea22-like family protein [Salmonella enterica]EAU9593867.1 ead/Ea22-like family protein [Salmonella enterica]EBN5287155.1 ead/Ea22-like family protein [Salmonella enterica]ECG8540391.1 ead/Ea22-like family protein [Salmonella enterica]
MLNKTGVDKRALREAAEKADSGDWSYGEFNSPDLTGGAHIRINGRGAVYCLNKATGGIKQSRVVLAYIAAFNPKVALALLDELEAKDRRTSELESDNAYIKNRHKELDLLIGKNILVMQAAIIEWQGTGDARKGLAWIYNTLFGPGELPDESEKDAQAYFDRKYAPLDEELMNLHRWFWEQSEAERAAAAGKGEAS